MIFGIVAYVFLGNVFGLKCVQHDDFYTLSARNEHTFRGVVTKTTYVPNISEKISCDAMESNERVWLHTFTFNVSETYKWNVADRVVLNRSVWSIHCTRWWSCDALIVWEEYVVTTNWKTLDGGLCWDCPYLLAGEYLPLEDVYDPAGDMTCVEYFDGCNTCTKSDDGISLCTLMYCGETETEAYCTKYEDPSITCNRGHGWSVCWDDWITYDTYCELIAAWVEKTWDWSCWTDVPMYSLKAIPDTCVKWYDGCNECVVDEWVILSCTERACIWQDVPRCINHDFYYLLPWHIDIIQWYVNQFSSSYTGDAYIKAIKVIKKRIAVKIKEVHNLMWLDESIVSIKKLQVYEFLLEALYAVDSMIY